MLSPQVRPFLPRQPARRTWPRNAVVRRPAACPAERRIGPHFIGFGVQQAGTSWWHRLITTPPQVHHSEALPKELPKELHYRGGRSAARGYYHARLQHLMTCFPVERLVTLVPDIDLTLWPNFRHLSPTPSW